MDDLGRRTEQVPGELHPDLTGGTSLDPSLSLDEKRERSRVHMEVPGFQTMRLVSPTGRTLVDRPERPAQGTLLPLIRKPDYDELRRSLSARFAMKKASNPLLDTLSTEGRKVFDRIKSEFAFKSGEVFELDTADRSGLYFIESGRVETVHTYPERYPHQCNVHEAGQYFGEYVVLDGMRRITVNVQEDTYGVWIPSNRFGTLVDADPSFLLNLTRMVLRSQSDQDNTLISDLSEAKSENEKTIAQLNAITATSEAINSAQDLEHLLQVILKEARGLVRAERGTVYLVDHDTNELYSFVSENGSGLRISLPMGQGFAGIAAERGITINIEDAYKDPRFLPEIDQETGYRTRSVLTMPISNSKGVIVGVIQLLNKMGEGVFNGDDEDVIATFGTQAAIAIERTLTAEENLRNTQLASVGNLAASIVHDLKAPLTVIQGYVDLLNHSIGEASQRAHIESISQQLHRMVGMTQEVLDFARGEIRLNPAQTKIATFVRDLCDSYANELKARSIELELDFGNVGKDWKVILDRDRFTRVLTNVITNAYEAMPGGGTLSIGLNRYDAHWELQISDTGVGIAPEQLDKILEPFVTHGKKHGTGLGLSIAKNVIDEHGGNIHIDSRAGIGTTVSIQMPNRPHITSDGSAAPLNVGTIEALRQLSVPRVPEQGSTPSLN